MADSVYFGDMMRTLHEILKELKLMNCTYLFVGNTLPAFLIIVGIIAKITGR